MITIMGDICLAAYRTTIIYFYRKALGEPISPLPIAFPSVSIEIFRVLYLSNSVIEQQCLPNRLGNSGFCQ